MRKVILYTAASIDGFIARENGAVDWLETPADGADYGYADFYKTIDTTIMGYKTYEQILSFGDFPYPDKKNYVFTRKQRSTQPYVEFVNADVADLINQLKNEKGADIWLVGGGDLNAAVLKAGLLDEIWLYVMPIALGSGIPLFTTGNMTSRFSLEKSEVLSGSVVHCLYKAIKS